MTCQFNRRRHVIKTNTVVFYSSKTITTQCHTHDATIIFIIIIFSRSASSMKSFKRFHSCRQKTQLTEKEIDKSKKCEIAKKK